MKSGSAKLRHYEVRNYELDPTEVVATFSLAVGSTAGDIAMAALDACGYGVYDADDPEGDAA